MERTSSFAIFITCCDDNKVKRGEICMDYRIYAREKNCIKAVPMLN
jgi:hypothetical protein